MMPLADEEFFPDIRELVPALQQFAGPGGEFVFFARRGAESIGTGGSAYDARATMHGDFISESAVFACDAAGSARDTSIPRDCRTPRP